MHEDWYSGPSPTWQFPNGTLFKKREGEVATVGEKQFLITRDMHESFLQGIEQWKVIFEGIDLQTSEPVVLKFRYVYFPKYIAHEEKQQYKEEPNPGAPVYIVVMSKIDALPVIAPGGSTPTDIFPGPLTAEDKQIIRRQCLEAMVALRQRGIPSGFLTFYFLGHSSMSRRSWEFSTPGPVTESSREFVTLINDLDMRERWIAQWERENPRNELEEQQARLRWQQLKEWDDAHRTDF
ncbi:citrate synthase [Paecilomyces lecythidis]|uniref:Citrate synthase n=1 Tax=Paecilomyces lecythidis TaxID=3004212 RepID=A0ABR3YFT3_9EURO